MKAWIFVEGPSDVLALKELWKSWTQRLRIKRHGIELIPLDTKSNFLKKIGPRAGRILAENNDDLVVALPDLYPVDPFQQTIWNHSDAESLKQLQRRLVKNSLTKLYGLNREKAEVRISRFLPAVFKHDFEMLLLVCHAALRSVLQTDDRLGNWRLPVEDQNNNRPPKIIIEELFQSKLKRKYVDTIHAPRILRKVDNLGATMHTESGLPTCPEFAAVLRWLGDKFDEPCCDLR